MVEAPHSEYQDVFGEGELLPLAVLQARLASCGEGVRVFRGARLVGAGRIGVGAHSQIDEGVRVFGGLGVKLGHHVHLAFGSSISGGGRCRIGDFVGIGAGVRIVTGTEIVDGSGLTNPTVPAGLRSVVRSNVEIHDHAVLFTGVIVLPGVTVGAGAVVAAGSVVHRDLLPWRIYAGHPLVPVKERPRAEVLRLAAGLASG
ncbi:MAG: acyltransferase [Verrucomicrobiae bacterium]|nr:acyltransferase [Verrucomicrobiae bacterium]MCP5523507.1 acyltransferase [Verrucomicrobiales bacterium]